MKTWHVAVGIMTCLVTVGGVWGMEKTLEEQQQELLEQFKKEPEKSKKAALSHLDALVNTNAADLAAGKKIRQWLTNNPEEDFIIVNDLNLMIGQGPQKKTWSETIGESNLAALALMWVPYGNLVPYVIGAVETGIEIVNEFREVDYKNALQILTALAHTIKNERDEFTFNYQQELTKQVSDLTQQLQAQLPAQDEEDLVSSLGSDVAIEVQQKYPFDPNGTLVDIVFSIGRLTQVPKHLGSIQKKIQDKINSLKAQKFLINIIHEAVLNRFNELDLAKFDHMSEAFMTYLRDTFGNIDISRDVQGQVTIIKENLEKLKKDQGNYEFFDKVLNLILARDRIMETNKDYFASNDIEEGDREYLRLLIARKLLEQLVVDKKNEDLSKIKEISSDNPVYKKLILMYLQAYYSIQEFIEKDPLQSQVLAGQAFEKYWQFLADEFLKTYPNDSNEKMQKQIEELQNLKDYAPYIKTLDKKIFTEPFKIQGYTDEQIEEGWKQKEQQEKEKKEKEELVQKQKDATAQALLAVNRLGQALASVRR